MNEKEFLENCMARAPEELRAYIPRAIESAESCFGIGIEGTFGKSFATADIPKVVQLAGVFHRFAEQNKEEYQSEPDILLNINPETIITSEELINDISPAIKKVRTTLFGNEDPPFPDDIDKAVAWLENQVREEALAIRANMPNNGAPIQKLTNQLLNQAQTLAKMMPDGVCSVTIRKLSIHYQAKDGKLRKLPVFKGKLSEVLSNVTMGISESTNFSQADLLTYLLTGIKPVLPCMRIRRGITQYPKVQVDFYRSLNYGEASSLIRNINSTLKPTKKELNAGHLDLYQFVARSGGVPATGKMEFWERLRREWNRDNPTRQFKSSKCIQIAYKRVLQALRIKR